VGKQRRVEEGRVCVQKDETGCRSKKSYLAGGDLQEMFPSARRHRLDGEEGFSTSRKYILRRSTT